MMAVRGAVRHWASVVGGYIRAVGHSERHTVRAMVEELVCALVEQFGCQMVVVGCVPAGQGAVRVMSVWARGSIEPSAIPQTVATDPGLEALASGRVDAVVLSNTERAKSGMAEMFRRAGCRTAVIVPVGCSEAEGVVVAVGFSSEPEALAERVSALLAALVPGPAVAA